MEGHNTKSKVSHSRSFDTGENKKDQTYFETKTKKYCTSTYSLHEKTKNRENGITKKKKSIRRHNKTANLQPDRPKKYYTDRVHITHRIYRLHTRVDTRDQQQSRKRNRPNLRWNLIELR